MLDIPLIQRHYRCTSEQDLIFGKETKSQFSIYLPYTETLNDDEKFAMNGILIANAEDALIHPNAAPKLAQ